MTQPGGFAPSDDASHLQPAADDEVGEPGLRAASQETTDFAPDQARLRRKPVVIAIAAVLALVLLGTGVGTGLAISGSRTGSAAASSNAGADSAFRLPAKLLGLARNTFLEPTDISPFEILTSHPVSGVYGAAPPHTRTILVVGGTLTPGAQSEARIAPADMAFYELQFPGSTHPQRFPARATSAGIACAYGITDSPIGTVIVCFSIRQVTVVEAIYAYRAASGLRDAAAKTVQIRSVLER